MKFRAWVLSLFVVVPTIPLTAQTCSTQTYTNTLICTLPQLFGPQGLTLPNLGHNAHFAGSSETTYLPLNQGIGQQLAILPLGSSGSGTTFTLDAQGHPVPTEDSLGPILTERANVIGRKAINLGVAYQYFSFSKIDGINLHSFPAVLTHEGWTPDLAVGPNVFKQDYIQTSNQVNLSLNQTVIYAVFGIANHMDASIELPIQSAHLRVISGATIVRTQPCEFTQNCSEINPDTGLDEATCGEFHYFNAGPNYNDCGLIFSSLTATFPYPAAQGLLPPSTPGGTPTAQPVRTGPAMTNATGIGDITIRGKYEVLHGEKLTGSIGLGVRFPSGDAKNFLGTGAYGITPFGVLSYKGRLSPHVRLGYQWNSGSVLAGDPTALVGPTTASLPPAWLYSGGADYRATKWLTIAADLIGQAVLGVKRLSLGSYSLLPEIQGVTPPTDADKKPVQSILISSGLSNYNSDAIAIGGKVRLPHEIVLIGNATIRVNDGGLRANVVPLVGASYAF
jgi:Putative MetA-pathway of phenol degradation